MFPGAMLGDFRSPALFSSPEWSYDAGLLPQPGQFNDHLSFTGLGLLDYPGFPQPSDKQWPMRLDLAEPAMGSCLDGTGADCYSDPPKRKPAHSFELSEAAPEFIPPPPGLGVVDRCGFSGPASDLQPLRIDLSEMLSAPPPGLPLPPGLEDVGMSKTCAVVQSASTPCSISTAADSFGDLSMSSDEGDVAFTKAPPAPKAKNEGRLELRLDAPRELRLERGANGQVEVHWPVDARKLLGKDRQLVSPSFEAFPDVLCKLMIKPKPKGLSKGLASFQKARGCGSIELKIVEGIEKAPAFTFRLSIGSGDTKEEPRGPVEHTFASSAVCGLPKESENWDFRPAIDHSNNTFMVSLELGTCYD